jgi:hypothetical protein
VIPVVALSSTSILSFSTETGRLGDTETSRSDTSSQIIFLLFVNNKNELCTGVKNPEHVTEAPSLPVSVEKNRSVRNGDEVVRPVGPRQPEPVMRVTALLDVPPMPRTLQPAVQHL